MYLLADLARPPATLRNAAELGEPNLELVVGQHSDAVVRWLKLKQMFVKLRGGSPAKNHKVVPRTTNSDVLQLAAAWSRELAKVSPNSDHQRSDHKRWQAAMEIVKHNADPTRPNALYQRNEEFWQDHSARLAIYLESRKATPSKWTLLKESFVETLADVPGALGNATHATAGAVADAGGAVADFVKKPINAALVLLGGAILLPPIIRAVRK